MPNVDSAWMSTIAKNIESSDISIVACVVAIIFFMKFNQKEGRNQANKYIGIALGFGFVLLVCFRIFKGVF